MLTVLTPRATARLVSLEAFKAEVAIVDSQSDEFLSSLLDRVSQMVEAICDRVLAQEQVREDFRQECAGEFLQLDRYPVGVVSAVTIDGEALEGVLADKIEVDAARLYRVDAGGNLVTWPPGRISVTYTGGYEPIPGNLQEAVLRLAKMGNAARSRDPSLQGENILSGLYSYRLFDSSNKSAVPDDVMSLLRPFIRYPL